MRNLVMLVRSTHWTRTYPARALAYRHVNQYHVKARLTYPTFFKLIWSQRRCTGRIIWLVFDAHVVTEHREHRLLGTK